MTQIKRTYANGKILFILIFLSITLWMNLKYSPNIDTKRDQLINDKLVNIPHNISTPNSTPPLRNNLENEAQRIPDALKKKIDNEFFINARTVKNSSTISPSEIYKELKRRGVIIEQELSNKMLANTLAKDDWDILSALMERALSQEENFKASLGEHITFESLKNAFHTRTKTTGYYYGNDLLEEPVSYRNTTFEDIKGILDTGAQLPENLMEHIVNEGNFELAVTLQKNGYNFNVNYVNGYTTQNSLELLISNITEHPYLYANYDEKASIDTLLALGVSTINTDGTRDALDYALQNMTPDNYSKKISIAEKLIQSGFRVEESHLYFLREFNKNYPDSFEKVREKFAHYVEQ